MKNGDSKAHFYYVHTLLSNKFKFFAGTEKVESRKMKIQEILKSRTLSLSLEHWWRTHLIIYSEPFLIYIIHIKSQDRYKKPRKRKRKNSSKHDCMSKKNPSFQVANLNLEAFGRIFIRLRGSSQVLQPFSLNQVPATAQEICMMSSIKWCDCTTLYSLVQTRLVLDIFLFIKQNLVQNRIHGIYRIYEIYIQQRCR